MTVQLDVLLQVAVSVTILIAASAGFVVWLRRWLQKQVVDPARQTYEQVAPNGGSQESTRHLIEQTADDVSGLKEIAQQNREIAVEARALAQATAARLDTHLLGHPTRE